MQLDLHFVSFVLLGRFLGTLAAESLDQLPDSAFTRLYPLTARFHFLTRILEPQKLCG